MADGGRNRWALDLVERLGELSEPSREDLFVLLLTWLQRHERTVTRVLRVAGRQVALIEPLPSPSSRALVTALSAAVSSIPDLAAQAVAAARALDLDLADTNPRLLTGEHLGIGGELFRVRPRVVPGGIDDLYGAAKDSMTFGVARRMACVPVGAVGDVRIVDAAALPAATQTRLAARREAGSLRVLVDAFPPDRSQWRTDGPWTSVQRRHDDAMAARIADVLDEAATQAVDLLVLPELALSPESVDHLKAELDRRRLRNPILIVVGITHVASVGSPLVVNEATLLDGRGRELLRHRKLVAFSAADGSGGLVEERLDPGGVIAVLPTPVGNVSLLICKDVFADGPEPALRAGYVTWLLVPSLSRSTGPQRDRASQLRPRRITTIVCNAWHDEDERVTAGRHVAAGPTLRPAASGSQRWLVTVPL